MEENQYIAEFLRYVAALYVYKLCGFCFLSCDLKQSVKVLGCIKAMSMNQFSSSAEDKIIMCLYLANASVYKCLHVYYAVLK